MKIYTNAISINTGSHIRYIDKIKSTVKELNRDGRVK